MGKREQTHQEQSGEAGEAGSPPSDQTERSPSAEVPSGAGCAWRPPARVDDCRILNVCGQGGMGKVYRAWDEALQRYVALKFILGLEPDAMEEARATARLQHPNIVTIHGVRTFDGHPYLIMEYLSGKTLDKITKPLSRSRVLEIGIELSRGLAAAHHHGVIHCDVKPENVMLTDDGQVKLLDFGVAKLATGPSTPNLSMDAKEAAPALPTIDPAPTDVWRFAGTRAYMAPESWSGSERSTPRSDVYSLGVVLFELYAGHTPFADVPPHSLSLAVQQRAAPLLTDVVPAADPGLAAIIARCLSRDPNARYASAEELHEALKRAASGVGEASTRWRESGSRETTPAARTLVFREVGELIVSVHSPEAPTDGEWDAYLNLCRAKMAREQTGVLVVTAGGGPTAQQRLAIRELLREGPVRAAVVTDSQNVHGIITVLGYLNPGIRTFNTATGLHDALKYLGVADPMVGRVLTEVGSMQRELA